MRKQMLERYTLITNLSFVSLAGMRTFTHALLVEETQHPFLREQSRALLRGFGTEASAPTFDVCLPSYEHEIGAVHGDGRFVVLTDDGIRPLMSHAIVRFKNGPEVLLSVENQAKPLDIQQWAGEAGERTILRVWEALEQKVRAYWTAPNMPIQQWTSLRR
jgi:hypothetical protein